MARGAKNGGCEPTMVENLCGAAQQLRPEAGKKTFESR
jgi:hypothetical protein